VAPLISVLIYKGGLLPPSIYTNLDAILSILSSQGNFRDEDPKKKNVNFESFIFLLRGKGDVPMTPRKDSSAGKTDDEHD
jgi:hypothetical protein